MGNPCWRLVDDLESVDDLENADDLESVDDLEDVDGVDDIDRADEADAVRCQSCLSPEGLFRRVGRTSLRS